MDDILGYKTPPLAVNDVVAAALRVDSELSHEFPDLFMRNFRCASEQLVLGGARALDTYYGLGKEISEKKIESLKSLLRKHGLCLEVWPDEPRQQNIEKLYTLIHLGALHRMPNDYQTLPEWRDWDETGSFFVWFDAWRKRIATNYCPLIIPDASKKECDQIAHDIAFGALLGYPGKAITTLVFNRNPDNDRNRYAEVEIAHMKDFDGAWVSYLILSDHKDDAQIVSHREFWNGILGRLYLADIFK